MWRAITEDDFNSSVNSAESTAYRTKLLASGQSDPLNEVIAQVTLEFREAIRSCDQNTLDGDTSFLPATSIYHAVAVIRHRLLTRFDCPMSEERKMEYRAAQKYLEDVCSCKRKILAPDAATATKPSYTKPTITERKEKYSRTQQDGL